ncbi:MAG: WecB/TagA/CpsF family glycosyltransferase, partial [Xanthobacteraceae bacterium]
DGMPVIWLLRVLGYPLTIADRTTWVDWFDDFLQQLNSRRLSMFILGHTAETLSRGIRLIEQRWPDIRISGHHGYFDIAETSEQNLAIIDTINAFNPDVLLIGMGMPRQEIWAHRYSARLGVPVIALGGAALDYFAAIIPTPPRWIGRLGFEWLYRLGCDPRRMAPRYLLEPMGLIYLICRRLIARRPGV